MQEILKKDGQLVILVDFRENSSGVRKEMERLGLKVIETNLNVGDYICSDRVCIERKTSDDFINSIIDGRLFQQVQELKDNFQKPLLIIEGNYFRESMNENAVKSALASIVLDFDVPVITTRDDEETAKIIYWLAKREQVKAKRPIGIKGRKKPKEIKKLQEHIISGFPGISETISKRILRKFRTIRNFVNSSKEDLKKVEGIGEKLSDRILKIINEDYGD